MDDDAEHLDDPECDDPECTCHPGLYDDLPGDTARDDDDVYQLGVVL